MDSLSRRRLLAVGGTAALAGCSGKLLSDGTKTPTGTDRQTRSPSAPPTTTAGGTATDAFDDILAVLPTSVDEKDAQTVRLYAPVPASDVPDGSTGMASARTGIADSIGLTAKSVDWAGVAMYDDRSAGIAVAVGSFDAPKPHVPDTAPADMATHREDGLFVMGFEQQTRSSSASPWQNGLDASEAALNDETPSLGDSEDVVSALTPLADGGYITLLPTYPVDGQSIPIPSDMDTEGIATVAIGQSPTEDGNRRSTAVVVFDSKSAVDESVIDSILGDYSDRHGLTVRPNGRRVVGSATYDSTTGQSNGPDVYFSAQYVDAAGKVVLTCSGGESVKADALTVYADDERVNVEWENATVQKGDAVRFDSPPFTPVRVEWSDPNSDATAVLTRRVAYDSTTFDGSYDAADDTVVFRYTGSQPAPTDNLRLQYHTTGESESSDEGTPVEQDTLQTGDEITVEDVPYGEQVVLMARVEYDHGSMGSSVAYVSTSPPGHFSLQRETMDLVFRADQSQPASNYRVTVDGTPVETQFNDEYDRLEQGNTLSISAETGQKVVVEWIGDDGPIDVFTRRLIPQVSFDLQRDGDVFELTYRGEQSWDASAFEVRVGPSKTVSFTDEYDTLEDGDSISIDPGTVRTLVRVEWVSGGRSTTLFTRSISRLVRFETDLTADGVELAFQGDGTWPAGEFSVTLDGETSSTEFADQYDTLTAGDSITVDADVGSQLEVMWKHDDESQMVFREVVHPTISFEYTYDESAGELTVTAETERSLDPDNLTLTIYSEDNVDRRDAWSETYDTVESGDSITVEVDSTLKAAVVRHEQWDVSDVFQPGQQS